MTVSFSPCFRSIAFKFMATKENWIGDLEIHKCICLSPLDYIS